MSEAPTTVDGNATSDARAGFDEAALSTRPTTTVGQRLLFLLFVSVGFVLFAAVTLLPMVDQYARLQDEERALATLVERLEVKNESLHQLAADIMDVPEKTEWLARYELGYQRPGETIIPVQPAGIMREMAPRSRGEEPKALVPHSWPLWAHTAETWADQRGILSHLLDKELQGIWLLIAGGLVVAAFVLFAPRRRVSVL